jgi:hypothetical protein
MKNETKGGPCESVSNERVKKFYLKSVHGLICNQNKKKCVSVKIMAVLNHSHFRTNMRI